jgi:hypothetical protein
VYTIKQDSLRQKNTRRLKKKLHSPIDLSDISNFTKEVRIGKVFKLKIDL